VKSLVLTLMLMCALALRGQTGAGCDADRQKLLDEYVKAGVKHIPTCADFTNDVHTIHFSFHALNSGDYKWAIITDALLTGSECIYQHLPPAKKMQVNSGYRNPLHNASIDGSAKESQHIYGKAVDMQTSKSSWDEYSKASKSCNACREPSGLSGWGHVHADWRDDKCSASW